MANNPVSPVQSVRDWIQRTDEAWTLRHKVITRCEEFMAGNRYEDDTGPFNKDRRLVEIRGQETWDTARHIVAKATERPSSIEARPVDSIDDPSAAEAWVALLDWQFNRPDLYVDEVKEEALQNCREVSLGVVWMDWVPDIGPYGERIFTCEDGRNFRWDLSYFPHHPLCSRLVRDKRMDVDEAREVYDAPWLQPDRSRVLIGKATPAHPLLRGTAMYNLGTYDDDKVTLRECWYKNDRTTQQDARKQKTAMPQEDRYMVCASGNCSYRSDTVKQLKAAGQTDGLVRGRLPVEAPCPVCGGMAERVDVREENQYVRAYKLGKRLVMYAPLCANPDGDQPLYDGNWPIPTARSYPGAFFTPYVKPWTCDATQMWDQQIADDQLATIGVQAVFEHRTILSFPWTGLTDGTGGRFEARDDQRNVCFRDAREAMTADLSIQATNASGLDPSYGTVYGINHTKLVQYRGTSDLGITEENSKDIAASTVAQLTKEAETPTEHFIRRIHREWGRFAGVVQDYLKATITPAQAVRLRTEGIDLIVNVSGDDLPDHDIIITDTPPFTGLDKEKANASQALMPFIQQGDSDGLEFFAELNDIPPSIVRKGVALIEERKAKLAAQAAAGGPPMGGPGAGPPLPPAPPPNQGFNGAGMSPALQP